MKIFSSVKFTSQICKRIFWLLIFGWVFAFSLAIYLDPVAQQIRILTSFPDHDYMKEIEQLAEEGRILEAIQTGTAVLELRDMPNEEEIRTYVDELEAEYGKFSRRAKDVVIGFITGKGTSAESEVARTVSDFLLIGDIRDLGREGWKEFRNDDGDKVVMALSAAGLVASAAVLVPEATSTASGAIAQPTFSVFKVLRRAGVLTSKFSDELIQILKKVTSSKSLAPAVNLIDSMGTLVKTAPTGSVPDLMRTVDSTEDLAVVSKRVAENPATATLLLRRTGRSGLKVLRAGGEKSNQTVRLMLRKGVKQAPKVAFRVRALEFIYSGGLSRWFALFGWVKYLVMGICSVSALCMSYQGVQLVRIIKKRKIAFV